MFFEEAAFTEARFIGINTIESDKTLQGDIEEFLIDDLGYSIDWTLKVKYIVADKTTNSTCYEGTKNNEANSSKFVNPLGALNEIVQSNLELLFSDQAFLECIK